MAEERLAAERVNRGKYWLAYLVWILAVIIGLGLMFALKPYAPLMIMLGILIVLQISCIAVGIKRLHDRDKSGWWLLLFLLRAHGAGDTWHAHRFHRLGFMDARARDLGMGDG